MSFQVTPFCYPMLRKIAQEKKNCENEKIIDTLIFEKLICESCLFTLRHIAAQCISFHREKEEIEQVPAK